MKTRTWVLILLVGLAGLRIASRLAVAYAVAEPHAPKGKIIKLAFNPPYEIASPHQGLAQDVQFALFPKVYAQSCFVGNCAKPGFKPVATCNSSCSAGCNCPDCTLGPCTIYKCKAAITSGGCTAGTNPDPRCALSCADDNSC